MNPRHLIRPHTATLLGLCLLLGACASLRDSGQGVAETPPRQVPVVLTQPPLTPMRARTYTDRWQRETYTLYAGEHGARAELIYAEATATDTALEYPRYGLRKLTESWRLNRNGLTHWGPTRHLQSGPRTIFYAPFRPAGADRQCVAFGSDWELTPDDPRQRPGKALFGYYCPAPGQPLGMRAIRKLLEGIHVGATPEEAEGTPVATSPDPGPGATGNPRFPFAFAQHYNVDGSAPFP